MEVRGLDVDTVWSLATGGSAVAADPHLRAPAEAVGPSAAGVSEASEWFRVAIESPDGPPRFLFLIGGPGGGKSQAASALVSGLEEIDRRDERLAHRIYRYRGAGRSVTLINDATIASGEGGILSDIQRAVDRGDHLVACINRGVLVDASRTPGATQAHHIAHWLTAADGSPTIESIKDRDYLRTAAIVTADGEQIALLTAVLVDSCSLLEVRPQVDLASGDLNPHRYRLGVFDKVDRAETPAGVLLSKVAKGLNWSHVADPDWDPVRANLNSIRHAAVMSNHLRMMRAAEIILGERFTYRELWGAISRLLFGDLPLRMSSTEATSYLTGLAPAEGATPVEEFTALRNLAQYRSFVALFGGLDTGDLGAAQDPVLRLMQRADPLLDARPGSTGEEGSGWASPVLDAFSSTALGGSPLESMEHEMPEAIRGIIQPFDRSLDLAFSRLSESSKADERSRATIWYGKYLTRLYAAALGIPSFREVVDAWTSTWTKAPVLPDSLNGPLRTLLSPRRDPSASYSNPVIPVYASRTEPILGYVAEPTLALRASTFQFDTRRDGESLHLRVKEEGVHVGSVLLDFDLLREALTCSDDWLGMTEAREKTEPRVERFRARRLVSERLARSPQLAVENGMRDDQLTIDQE